MANLPVVAPNPIPTFKQPITDETDLTTRPWYFFFQSLYNNLLKPTGVTPGSYTNTNLTVNANGVITAASNGTGGGVSQIVAGTNVTLSPPGGTGVVTVSASGGTTVAVPGTIPDLQLWWEADDILSSIPDQVVRLRERTPWIGGVLATFPVAGGNPPGIVNLASINGLNTLQFGVLGTPVQGYPLSGPFSCTSGSTSVRQGTIFIVALPDPNNTPNQVIIGGDSACMNLFMNLAGANSLVLANGSVAFIGTSSVPWTAGVAFQANVTVNFNAGTWAFRQARAPAGTGGGAAGGTGLMKYIGGDGSTGTASTLNNGSLGAVIIYTRVLSPTEITNVENYLFAKWGV